MRTLLLFHVLTGGLGLLSGYLAISAAKGATLHRKAGMVFVYVMTMMAVTGMVVAITQGVAPAINVPSSLLVLYMVMSSLITVTPSLAGARRLALASMLFGSGIAVTCVVLAVIAIAGGGRDAGLAYPLVIFGAVAVLAAHGDRRVMRTGPLRGAPRLKRHLWRMCFALFVASIAFFLGPDRLPEAFRHPAFRGTGVLLPIATIAYWRWKLRARKSVREPLTGSGAPLPAES